MNDENTKTETPTYDEAYFASEARFVYMRPEIDAAIASGTPAEQALTPFGELPEDEKQRWINAVVHVGNLLQAMNKESKDVEESGTDGTTDENPIPSYQDVRDAYNRLEKLVDSYGDRAILQLVIANGEGDDMFLHFGNNKVSASDGSRTDALNWCGVRGNMLRANLCFEHDVDAIGDGVKYTILAMQKKGKKEDNPLVNLLGKILGNP